MVSLFYSRGRFSFTNFLVTSIEIIANTPTATNVQVVSSSSYMSTLFLDRTVFCSDLGVTFRTYALCHTQHHRNIHMLNRDALNHNVTAHIILRMDAKEHNMPREPCICNKVRSIANTRSIDLRVKQLVNLKVRALVIQ